jgi:hypothetical protein
MLFKVANTRYSETPWADAGRHSLPGRDVAGHMIPEVSLQGLHNGYRRKILQPKSEKRV